MGFIPETVTRRLPSAVVGTLGVDPSGEQLGLAVARAGEQVTRTLLEKQAKRKQTLDIISAQAEIRKYETSMDEISKVNQGSFRDDPQGGVKQTLNDGETLLNSTLQDIGDDNVRAMVATETTSSLIRTGNSMKGWAHQQEVINGAQDFTSVTDADAAQLSQTPDLISMGTMLANHNLREGQAKALYGKNWPEAMKKGRQSIIKGQITGYELNDPQEGIKFLEETDFKGAFDSEEIKGFKKDMRSSFEGWNKKVELDKKINTLSLFDGVAKRQKEGELDVAFVDQLELELDDENLLTPEVQKLVDDVRKVAAENMDLDSVHATKIFNNLNDDLRRLQISSDKTEADATLTELFKFRSKVYEASANGEITPKERRSFLDQIETPSKEMIARDDVAFERKFKIFGGATTPEGAAFDKVNGWLEEMNFSEEVAETAKAKILSDTFIEMTELRDRGVEVTLDSVDILVERHFREEETRQNAALRHIPPEGKAMRLKNGNKILLLPSGVRIPIQ